MYPSSKIVFYSNSNLEPTNCPSLTQIELFLFDLIANKEMQLSINDLLASILHMNLDRLFMGRNRTNEFVVYDLLSKYYKSTLARLKSTSIVASNS